MRRTGDLVKEKPPPFKRQSTMPQATRTMLHDQITVETAPTYPDPSKIPPAVYQENTDRNEETDLTLTQSMAKLASSQEVDLNSKDQIERYQLNPTMTARLKSTQSQQSSNAMKVAQTKLKTLRHASPEDMVVRFEHRVVNKTKSFEVNNLQSGPPSVQQLDS